MPHVNISIYIPDDGGWVAKAFATSVGVLWNFSINNFWTFRKIV
jgi:putative flippase GtrA